MIIDMPPVHSEWTPAEPGPVDLSIPGRPDMSPGAAAARRYADARAARAEQQLEQLWAVPKN